MPYFAFRPHIAGEELVLSIFPINGGSAVAEKRIPLNAIGLQSTGEYIPPHEIPAGDYSTTLQRLNKGGIKAEIDHEKQLLTLTPISATGGGAIESYALAYTFDELNLENSRDTDIKQAIDTRTIRVTREVETDY